MNWSGKKWLVDFSAGKAQLVCFLFFVFFLVFDVKLDGSVLELLGSYR